MNKTQLIDAIAQRYEGNRKQAQHALESVLDTITREVARGEKVAITGFGSFQKQIREARMVRNPRTGERMRAKKTAIPKFTAGADLKAIVSGAKKLPKLPAAQKATAPARKAADAAKKSAPAKAAASAAKKATATKSAATKTTATKTTSTAKKTTAKKATPAASTTSAAKKTAAKKAPAKKSTAKTAAPTATPSPAPTEVPPAAPVQKPAAAPTQTPPPAPTQVPPAAPSTDS